ncbi:hypothetical protein ACIRD8_01355 [Streptomyces sp. NPDC102451]|uniref:hypothetical protein n=1 Tax=Streptomyces sp. NPDC102451 TaxID=3366177 RepID=UPI00382E191A
MSDRSFPLSPQPEDDARFTRGLSIDVADVLVRHGYPEPTGLDWVELQLALFRFLYETGGAA